MSANRKPGVVLAVHPTSRGFGWVVFEGPLALANWGTARAKKKNRNAQCIKRFEKLLNQYQPRTLVLEKFENAEPPRSERLQLLARTMQGFAANRDIETPIYSRTEVGQIVARDANATRHEIAGAVAKLLPILEDRMPPARRLWQPEDSRQSLFDAAALAITHSVVTRRGA
jgi:Holliday junction resolvasome RuvABC endonuclease subunit